MVSLHSEFKLEANNVSFFRNEKTILKNVSFSLENGQLLYIKGQNGSGKTTLLKILINLVSPDEGSLSLNHKSIGKNPFEFASQCLYIGHRSALKPELTAEENLKFLTQLDGETISHDDCLDALHYFDLSLHGDLQVRSLSAGQQRKTALARLVNSKKCLWILDEPFTSIDVGSQQKLVKLFDQHLKNNGLIITTSHQSLNLSNDIQQQSLELG